VQPVHRFLALVTRELDATDARVELGGQPDPGAIWAHLEGDFRVGADVFVAGDYLRYPPGSAHDEATSDGGCVALILMPRDSTGGILVPADVT
jgi:hypothetical protein